jgi:hypothetical protein
LFSIPGGLVMLMGLQQALAELAVPRIQIDVLDFLGGHQRIGTLPPSALGLADAPPIGGLVAGASKAASLDKTLQQIEGMPILGLPIWADPPDDLAEQATG